MTLHQIIRVLEIHNINYWITKNEILAEEAYTTPDGRYNKKLIDVTGWNKRQFAEWLAY